LRFYVLINRIDASGTTSTSLNLTIIFVVQRRDKKPSKLRNERSMAQLSEFISQHWMLVLALVVIAALLVMDAYKRKLLGYREIKPQEAVQLINHEGAVAVDVREDKEYGEGHILNALHIPYGLIEKHLAELEPYKTQPVIVYCRSGQRSAQAGVVLRKQGFERVYKLNGGMMAWRGADLPVVK
jgi:rhodanese-related sulfurtransferase